MARKIDAWQANDGSLHDCEAQAVSRESFLDINKILHEAVDWYDQSIEWADLWANRQRLIDALQGWNGDVPDI